MLWQAGLGLSGCVNSEMDWHFHRLPYFNRSGADRIAIRRQLCRLNRSNAV